MGPYKHHAGTKHRFSCVLAAKNTQQTCTHSVWAATLKAVVHQIKFHSFVALFLFVVFDSHGVTLLCFAIVLIGFKSLRRGTVFIRSHG